MQFLWYMYLVPVLKLLLLPYLSYENEFNMHENEPRGGYTF